jgi:hypothetical protein
VLPVKYLATVNFHDGNTLGERGLSRKHFVSVAGVDVRVVGGDDQRLIFREVGLVGLLLRIWRRRRIPGPHRCIVNSSGFAGTRSRHPPSRMLLIRRSTLLQKIQTRSCRARPRIIPLNLSP